MSEARVERRRVPRYPASLEANGVDVVTFQEGHAPVVYSK